MDMQIYVNIALTIVTVVVTGIGVLVMFILAGMRSCLDRLQEGIRSETRERNKLAISLANNYVTWPRLLKELDQIFAYLRRIEDKLDSAPCKTQKESK